VSREPVLIVGAGPIGLACGWAAQERGLDVTVLDAGGDGAWRHAAGMLAPVTEAEFGERALLELGLRSAKLYETWAPARVRATGTLLVARDSDEAAALDRLHAFRTELGLPAERLRPSQARRLEPALAPTVRLALDVPGDRAVDPAELIAALRDRLDVRDARVSAVAPDGVTLADGDRLAGRPVVAAGLGSAALTGLPVRAIKGQIMRLRDPNGPGLVERSIRTEHGYLVPRGDGRYVLGATMEERADDRPTAGGLFEIVRDMSEVVPGVLEMEIDAFTAGRRPASPDNLPVIGAHDGVLVATGHGRNGILLAPVTGELVAGLLEGGELPEWAQACSPARFVKVAA
jgi:glycine oxidase